MRAEGFIRGHPVRWDRIAHCWRWADSGERAEGWGGEPRPCPSCGLLSRDGSDPCLGTIPGAIGACCGHSAHDGYLRMAGDDPPPGWRRGAYVGVD